MMATYHAANVLECEGDVVAYARDGIAVAHCISGDCAMGAGIARALDVEFGMRQCVLAIPDRLRAVGNAIEVRTPSGASIFNLVTKATHSELPTYAALGMALESLRFACDKQGLELVVMPRLGCGIDRLEWSEVLPLIVETFSGCAAEARICYLPTKQR